MGGQGVAPQEIIKYLNDLCSVALSLGMTLKEYWEDDPYIINFYIKAEDIKARKENNKMWVQGAYIYQALCCASPMFNSLAKDHKPRPYLKEPFAMSEEEQQERFENKVTAFMDSLVGKEVRK